MATSTSAQCPAALIGLDFGARDGMHPYSESWGRMGFLFVGHPICTKYHPPPGFGMRCDLYGRPRIVAQRLMPFDIANEPKRALWSAAGGRILFNFGPVAVATADKGETPPRYYSEVFKDFKCGERHIDN